MKVPRQCPHVLVEIEIRLKQVKRWEVDFVVRRGKKLLYSCSLAFYA
jgi:hypothetical protein